jgi:PHP family Zn ribbon phosphoesterase
MVRLCSRCLGETIPFIDLEGVPSMEDIRSYLLFPSIEEMTPLETKLSDTIQDFDEQIHRLQEMKNDLTQQLERVKGIASPVRRLPPELLESIFFAYCEVPCAQTRLSNERSVSVELLLTQVCSYWRSLSITMDLNFLDCRGVLRRQKSA